MQYLVWQDHDPKRSTLDKIRGAVAAYEQRFHTRPKMILVHKDECISGPLDVLVVSADSQSCVVARGNYWAGPIG